MNKDNFKLRILIMIVLTIVLSTYISIALEKNISTIKVEGEETPEPLPPPTTVEEGASEEEIDTTPESLTGLVVGFDVSGGLTDVLMVGHLDTETNEVKLISIPRDLDINFNDEAFKHIKENNPKNNINHCKLTEVYSRSGWDERAFEDVREIVEIITGLKIDYVMRLDVYGFTEIVDIIGGVEFDVPQNMYKVDPIQDLHINLKKGVQMLDGDKAEQLVRFRGYVMGDLQRIQVQQDFLVALGNKVLEIRDFNKIRQIATSVYDMVEADFGLLLLLQYAEYLYEQDLSNLLQPDNMIQIPSYGEEINEISYQKWYLDEAHRVVDELINPKVDEGVEDKASDSE